MNAADRETLLDIALASIRHGFEADAPLDVDPALHGPALRAQLGCFVTLRIDDALRGCVGTVRPYEPLITNAARNAYRAAFGDRRFDPLEPDEFQQLDVHLSVLGATEPIPCASESELLAALRPGEDGLVLLCGNATSTFLPAVWERIPDPSEFLEHLRLKAGLSAGFWSDELRFERYRVDEFGRGPR